jgi:hypothetical protein
MLAYMGMIWRHRQPYHKLVKTTPKPSATKNSRGELPGVLLLLPVSVWVGPGTAPVLVEVDIMDGDVCSLSRVARVSIKSSRMKCLVRMRCVGGSGKMCEVVQRSQGLGAGCSEAQRADSIAGGVCVANVKEERGRYRCVGVSIS